MNIFCTLVGTSYRSSDAKCIVNSMKIGDIVTFETEPDNAYDSFAVKCFGADEHIGYLSRDNNVAVFYALKEDGEIFGIVIDFDDRKPVLEIILP